MTNSALMDKCLFLPAWWLTSYCDGVFASRGHAAASAAVGPGRLIPMLAGDANLVMMTALSLLQAQLISDAATPIPLCVSAGDLRRRVGSGGASYVLPVLQSLPYFRILTADEPGCLTPVLFFADERWTTSDHPDDVRLELSVRPEGAELLLAPTCLMLWTSIWADLTSGERILYARMEQVMQSESGRLPLDGIFSLSLDELFKDLPAGHVVSSSGEREEFVWRRKVLQRLGHKLCRHGLLEAQVDAQYLNRGSDSHAQLNLVWQASKGRLLSDDLAQFRQAATRRIAALRSPEAVKVSDAAEISSVQPKSLEKEESPAPPVFANKAPSYNIKRLASEELMRMRQKDPNSYKQLKLQYLGSLEPTRQKIILDVQQHMQPDMFDEHLQPSLIKYMVENPSAWKN